MQKSRSAPFFALAMLVLVVGMYFAPVVVSAEGILDSGIVPQCAKQSQAGVGFAGACQLCDLVKLADNIVRFAVAFSVIVATLMFAYAGVLYFTASSKPDNIKKAHTVFAQVVVGLVLILVAWLIVDIIMKTLANNDPTKPWKEISCLDYPKSDPLNSTPDPNVSGYAGPRVGGGTGSCTDCTAVPQDVFNCSSSGCQASAALNPKLASFKQNLGGVDMIITEGYPPAYGHAADGQHYSGSAVDMARVDRNYTAQNIADVLSAGRRAGLHVFFEVKNCSELNGVRDNVAVVDAAAASQVRCVPTSSADHFHVGL